MLDSSGTRSERNEKRGGTDGDDDGVHARREVTQGVAGTFGVLEASCYSLNAVEGVYVL